MRHIRDFTEAHQALHAYYGATTMKGLYTLDRMRTLLKYLGDPQERLKIIHVAGTSGKTSTAYYVAALLTAAGHSTGLTVSPHVDEVNERLQIDLVPLPETEFCAALERFLEQVEASGIRPSYFELMIAFAFSEFARRNVDYAVVEVGLGGRLDGTNTIQREDKVCVITDIGLDHTEILGDTIPKIAAEKAGIIQPGNHVFMHRQGDDVMGVVARRCDEQRAALHLAEQGAPAATEGLPAFQQRNFGLALAAVSYALKRDGRPVLTMQQQTTAARTYIPARMETVRIGARTLIMDGAHNGQKIGTLLASMREKYGVAPITALVAFTAASDQHWQLGVDALLPVVSKLIITSFQVEQDLPKRAVEPARLAAYCREKGYEHIVIERSADRAYQLLMDDPVPLKLVVGSFYLLNDIRPIVARELHHTAEVK